MTRSFRIVAAGLVTACVAFWLFDWVASVTSRMLPSRFPDRDIPASADLFFRRPDKPSDDRSRPARLECPGRGAHYYFLRDTFTEDLDPLTSQDPQEAFSSMLAALEQPSMSCGQLARVSSFRVSWHGAFDPPLSVRVWNDAGILRYETAELWPVTSGAVELATVLPEGSRWKVARTTGVMGLREASRATAAIARSDFWSMPSTDTLVSGLDGGTWLLEGTRNGMSHAVHRWSPHDGAFATACLQLLRGSGLTPRRNVH